MAKKKRVPRDIRKQYVANKNEILILMDLHLKRGNEIESYLRKHAKETQTPD